MSDRKISRNHRARYIQAAVLFLLSAMIFLPLYPSESPFAQTKEITIRNVTLETVRYTIGPLKSDDPPTEHSLKIDTINRHPSEEAMRISFQCRGDEITYVLDPGFHYSFRYDENDELELYEGSHGREDAVDLAPFVASPPSVVEKMLEMAQMDKDDIIYDLGCGDGRIVIMAAVKYGARGVGIDIDPQRIEESEANAKAAGVSKLVRFFLEDVTKSDISEATVVTLYLLTESNELMRPLLNEQLKQGVFVVTHNYRIPGWELMLVDETVVKGEDGEIHNIYAYRR
jgi:SAM-dependent methyltransferase